MPLPPPMRCHGHRPLPMTRCHGQCSLARPPGPGARISHPAAGTHAEKPSGQLATAPRGLCGTAWCTGVMRNGESPSSCAIIHAMPCRAMWCAPVSCAARLGGIEARLGRPCTRYLGHDPTTPTSQCAALATLVPLEVVGGGPGRGLRHRARQPDCLLRVRQSCCCMDQAVRGSSGYEYEVAPCPARQGGDDTAPHRTALHHDAGADGLPRTGRLPFPTASTSPI